MGSDGYAQPYFGMGESQTSFAGLGLFARACNIDWTSPEPGYPSWWGTGPGGRPRGPEWEMMGRPQVPDWWIGPAPAPPPPDFSIDPNDPLNRRPKFSKGSWPKYRPRWDAPQKKRPTPQVLYYGDESGVHKIVHSGGESFAVETTHVQTGGNSLFPTITTHYHEETRDISGMDIGAIFESERREAESEAIWIGVNFVIDAAIAVDLALTISSAVYGKLARSLGRQLIRQEGSHLTQHFGSRGTTWLGREVAEEVVGDVWLQIGRGRGISKAKTAFLYRSMRALGTAGERSAVVVVKESTVLTGFPVGVQYIAPSTGKTYLYARLKFHFPWILITVFGIRSL